LGDIGRHQAAAFHGGLEGNPVGARLPPSPRLRRDKSAFVETITDKKARRIRRRQNFRLR